MKKKLAKKWVEDLRSGKYKQTDGELKNSDGYCCLGVLCMIGSDKMTKSGKATIDFDEYEIRITDDDSESTAVDIPEGVCYDIGLSQKFMQKLMKMNDGGKDFEEIADRIEKKYLKD